MQRLVTARMKRSRLNSRHSVAIGCSLAFAKGMTDPSRAGPAHFLYIVFGVRLNLLS